MASDSNPERLPDAFRLHKQRCGHAVEAIGEVWRAPGGWHMRVVVSDAGVKWSARVATDQERRDTLSAWRDALVSSGWA